MTKETSKCYQMRTDRGYFDKYLTGKGIDIGGGDDCLRVPNGTVDCYDKAQGNAQFMNNIEDNTYNFVYSSHCLEHMHNLELALKHWIRICKPSGYLYCVVPDELYYEQGFWPSRWNPDHKWSFTLDVPSSQPRNVVLMDLLKKIEGVDVMEVFSNLQNYNFDLARGIDQTLKYENLVCCQFEFILKKK